MSRAFRRGADTALIALFLLLPVMAAPALGIGAQDTLSRAAAATASLAMPEAALGAIEEHMREVTGEHDIPVPAAQDAAAPRPEPSPAPAPETPPEPAYDPEDIAAAEAAVPEERRGAIETTQYLTNPAGEIFIPFGAATIRNATEFDNAEMLAAASGQLAFELDPASVEPQVLVVHTHSTESYDRFDAGFYDAEYPTRSTDDKRNIIAVGAALCEELDSLGIAAVHATEYHDYPSYNNSYSRSAETIKRYLAQYPTISVVLDIHRDGIQREDGTRLKPTSVINGEKTAQIMIVCGAGDEWDAVPNFRQNLAFAARLADRSESMFGGLNRPVYLAYRHYNQDLTPGSLLVEVGSESNTLLEAQRAARLLARALADLLGDE